MDFVLGWDDYVTESCEKIMYFKAFYTFLWWLSVKVKGAVCTTTNSPED